MNDGCRDECFFHGEIFEAGWAGPMVGFAGAVGRFSADWAGFGVHVLSLLY